MDLLIKSQDALLLLIIPLMFLTAMDVKRNWRSLWDNNLTAKDRSILLRASLFLLEPIVVLFHELGHAVAIKIFGGSIVEFHYALLSGYVVPAGSFTDTQLLIIYLAGNVVEIAIGYVLFAAAFFVSSPPVVATLVYLGVWSIASSAILYALMSFFNLYGDWIHIYMAPLPHLVAAVGVWHGLVIASVVYFLIGTKPQLWFATKTRPVWAKEYEKWKAKTDEDKSPDNLVRLAWLYFEASLNRQSRHTLDECLAQDPSNPQALYLYGWLEQEKLNLDRSEDYFMKVVNSERTEPLDKARAYMGIATARLNRSSRDAPKRIAPDVAKVDALQAYAAASAAAPDLADPRFHCAVLLNDLHRHTEAMKELESLAGLNWFDRELKKRVPEQMQIAMKKETAEQ